MGKYTRRGFQLGEWYLCQRSHSPAWYRARFDARTRNTDRVSLCTTDEAVAQERLTAWFYENRRLSADAVPPEKMPLVDALLDYWTGHAINLESAKSRKILIRYWNEFWGGASIAEVRSAPRQEAFHKFLADKGLNTGSINRTLECGAAAINRAWKRGVISSAPYVMKVPDARVAPKGRPLSVEELRQFYHGSIEEHWRDLMTIVIGTACRAEAARALTKAQMDFEQGLITLNPEGREQTIKYRPVVRMPDTLRRRFQGRPEGFLVRWRGERIAKHEKVMRAARKRAGLDTGVNLYSVRHTCSRWMRSQGVSMDDIGCQLGHKPEGNDTTMIYVTFSPDYLRAPCAALEKLLQAVCGQEAGKYPLENPTIPTVEGLRARMMALADSSSARFTTSRT
jgi:integrase